MNSEIDEILAAIRDVSGRIDQLPEGDTRAALEVEREQLRARARLIGDTSRRRSNLAAELEAVEAQLAALRETGITPALHEQYKMITDPSAYRRRINETIEANSADRLEELERRRVEILEALHTQDMSS